MQTFSANSFQQPLSGSIYPLKDKDYKRDWAQEQARAKLRAMRGSGMSDVAIGKLVGGSEPITGVFIGAVLRETDPKPVSQRVWDGLIERAGFIPVPPGITPNQGRTEKVGSPLTEMVGQEIAREVMVTIQRQTDTIDTLTRLLKTALDQVEKNGARLASVEAELKKLNRKAT